MNSGRLSALILGIIMAVSVNGCREEIQPGEDKIVPPIPPVDFVAGHTFGQLSLINKADYNFFKGDTLIVSDTLISGGDIVFKTSGDYMSYEWKIGNDDRTFTTQSVKLYFFDAIPELPVTLTVHMKSTTDADSVVTVNKKFVVVDYFDNPIFGVFKGANTSDLNNTFDVEISHRDILIDVTNINKGCEPIVPSVGTVGVDDFFITYKQIYFVTAHYYQSCSYPLAWAKIDATGKKISVDYTVGGGTGDYPDAGTRTSMHFTGTRKN